MIVEERTSQISGGHEIAYKFVKNGDAPVVVFANGAVFNYTQFESVYLPKLRSQLGDDFSYLLYDYIGYGRSSDLGEYEYDLEELADHQIELMDNLDIDEAHLFGLSKGSLVSHLVTAKYSDRVLSLAAYGSPNPVNMEGREKVLEYYRRRLSDLQNLQDRFDEYITEDNYDEIFDQIYVPSIFDCHIEELNPIQKVGAWFMRKQLKSLILGPQIGMMDKLFRHFVESVPEARKVEYMELMKSIEQPVLLMHGEKDNYIPYSSSLLLHKWIKNSEFKLFSGYKHNIPTLAPWQGARIMSEYASFVDGVVNHKKIKVAQQF